MTYGLLGPTLSLLMKKKLTPHYLNKRLNDTSPYQEFTRGTVLSEHFCLTIEQLMNLKEIIGALHHRIASNPWTVHFARHFWWHPWSLPKFLCWTLMKSCSKWSCKYIFGDNDTGLLFNLQDPERWRTSLCLNSVLWMLSQFAIQVSGLWQGLKKPSWAADGKGKSAMHWS